MTTSDDLKRVLRAFIVEVLRKELKLTSAKPANDEYLSMADAALIARVTPGTIRRWVREKTLTKHGKGARVPPRAVGCVPRAWSKMLQRPPHVRSG